MRLSSNSESPAQVLATATAIPAAAPLPRRTLGERVRNALRMGPWPVVATSIAPLPLAAWAPPSAHAFGGDASVAFAVPAHVPAPQDDEQISPPPPDDGPLLLAVPPLFAGDIPPPPPSPNEVADQLSQFAKSPQLLGGQECEQIKDLLRSGPLNPRGIVAAGQLFERSKDQLRIGSYAEGLVALNLLNLVKLDDWDAKVESVYGWFSIQTGGKEAILDLLRTGGLGDASERIVDRMLKDCSDTERLNKHLRWVKQGRFGQQTDAHAMGIWARCMDQQALNMTRDGNTDSYRARMDRGLTILQSGVLGVRCGAALQSFLREFERGWQVLDRSMLSEPGFAAVLQTAGMTPEELARSFPKAAKQVHFAFRP
jgi:hypothetical protein